MAYIQRAGKFQIQPQINESSEKKTSVDNNSEIKEESSTVYQTKAKNPEQKSIIAPPDKTSKTDNDLITDNSDTGLGDKKESNFADKLAKKTKSGFLSKVINLVKEEYKKPAEEALPFTIENLQKLWDGYWKDIDSQSTQILFKTAVLTIEDEEKGKIKVIASGNRAKDAIQRERTLRQLLIDKFQKKALEFDLEIDEEIVEKPQPKKLLPQSSREKYVYFLQLNPLLKDFQKRFELLPSKKN